MRVATYFGFAELAVATELGMSAEDVARPVHAHAMPPEAVKERSSRSMSARDGGGRVW